MCLLLNYSLDASYIHRWTTVVWLVSRNPFSQIFWYILKVASHVTLTFSAQIGNCWKSNHFIPVTTIRIIAVKCSPSRLIAMISDTVEKMTASWFLLGLTVFLCYVCFSLTSFCLNHSLKVSSLLLQQSTTFLSPLFQNTPVPCFARSPVSPLGTTL